MVMTDKEQTKLCECLRDPSVFNIAERCEEAADEIERLSTELRQLKRDLTWTRDRLVNKEQRGND